MNHWKFVVASVMILLIVGFSIFKYNELIFLEGLSQEEKKLIESHLTKQEKSELQILQGKSDLVEGLVKQLPEFAGNFLHKYHVKVLPVNGLISNGLYVENQNLKTAIILIDLQKCDKPLKDFLSERENRPFEKGDLKIQVSIKGGNRFTGCFFTLLHEIGHVVYRFEKIPQLRSPKINASFREEYEKALEDIVFQLANEDGEFNEPKVAKLIGSFNYFRKEKYRNEEMGIFFRQLQDSGVTTIYGMRNLEEDFSDLFAYFFLNKNFEIHLTFELVKNGALLGQYSPCENENRCSLKANFIKLLIRK